jgi:hypothetical protein
MHYSGYMELQDGAMSVFHLSQQEAVACVQVFRKEVIVVKGSCLRVKEIENVTV